MIKSLKEIYMDGIIDCLNFKERRKNRDPHPIYTRNIYLFIYLAKQMNIKRNDNNNNQR